MLNLDYGIIGLILGVIAIGIAVVAFLTQVVWNKRVERMTKEMNDYNQHHKKIEDSIKESSLKSLKVRLKLVKHHFETIMDQLDKQPSLDRLNDLIYNVGFTKVFQVNSRGLQRHADNIKFLVLSEFHTKVETLSRRLQSLSDLETIKVFPNAYELWMERAKTAIKEVDELQARITDELKSLGN